MSLWVDPGPDSEPEPVVAAVVEPEPDPVMLRIDALSDQIAALSVQMEVINKMLVAMKPSPTPRPSRAKPKPSAQA